MCDGFSEALLIGGIVAMAAGTAYSAYASYEQGQAAKQQADAQAAEYMRQAELNEQRAGIAQIQGEEEAAKRSRALSAEIGSTYANWAGNGLLVDGAGRTKDSLTDVVSAQTKEGVADISTIRDNTKINIWNYKNNAASQVASGLNAQVAGENAATAGVNNAISTGLTGAGQVMSMGASGVKNYGWGTKNYSGIFS